MNETWKDGQRHRLPGISHTTCGMLMVVHDAVFIAYQKAGKGVDIKSPHDRPLGLYGAK